MHYIVAHPTTEAPATARAMLEYSLAMPSALAQFAKAARPGRVKTRLEKALSKEECAALHAALVEDVWQRLGEAGADARFLFSDEPWEPYEKLPGAEPPRLQRGGDLGERMLHCFEDLAAEGFDRILIVGSDAPTLPVEYVERGLEALRSFDAVLGPAEDGGYYAVGCRHPHPEMFAGVEWSSPQTLSETQFAFWKIGYSPRHLPRWWDVDRPEDLRRLAADPELGVSVRAWFESRGERALS